MRLINIFEYNGLYYYLFNVKSYHFRLCDATFKPITEFKDHKLDEALAWCTGQGYILKDIIN